MRMRFCTRKERAAAEQLDAVCNRVSREPVNARRGQGYQQQRMFEKMTFARIRTSEALLECGALHPVGSPTTPKATVAVPTPNTLMQESLST